jgi:hypothetical protein
VGVLVGLSLVGFSPKHQGIPLDPDDIGGTVTGPEGPEAGVWVIAETGDLPTKFVRIVVTDEQGRYLLPDLPKASYRVWVRGYGLVDSPKQPGTPGRPLNLTAVSAPNPQAAAQYYPAGYWFSLLHVPDASEFPGTGPEGNGIPTTMRSQGQWLRVLKSGTCLACHQLGNQATREIPAALGSFASTVEAWDRRIQSGQAGDGMSGSLEQLGRKRALAMFADWTDRITAGELPPAPPRPQGIERNVVITRVGLGRPQGLPARPGLDRPAQAHAECQRPRVWRTRAERGLPAGARSGAPPGEQAAAHGARHRHAAHQSGHAAAVALLGQRGALDQQEQRAQPDGR